MSNTIPTLTIKTENGPVIINASDFDPAVHKLYTPEMEKEEDGFDREAAKVLLTEKGITFAKNVSDAKLKSLIAELDEEPSEE